MHKPISSRPLECQALKTSLSGGISLPPKENEEYVSIKVWKKSKAKQRFTGRFLF